MEDTREEPAPRSRSELGDAAARISAIVTAAEQEAEKLRAEIIREAEAEAAEIRAEADRYSAHVKRNARADAREILREAQEAAREVMTDGSQLAGHLRELSGSLNLNAEKLLQDVRLAHARLTAELDQATPQGDHEPVPNGPRVDPSDPGADPDFEVPEFVPGHR